MATTCADLYLNVMVISLTKSQKKKKKKKKDFTAVKKYTSGQDHRRSRDESILSSLDLVTHTGR